MFTRRETIGIIGTGPMGSAMAERLLAAGFRVLGWDCDAARLAASGAEAAAAQRCDCLVLSLPESRSLGSVLDEINSILSEGSVILDMSTGDPADAQRFAEIFGKRDVAFLDATISGSGEQLRRGEALWMVGRAEASYADCEFVLKALGGPEIYLGASGNAARMRKQIPVMSACIRRGAMEARCWLALHLTARFLSRPVEVRSRPTRKPISFQFTK